MIKITVAEVAEVVCGKLTSKNSDAIASGFSIDSRTIKPGQFFIAIKGNNFDGHDFIEDAIDKGAVGFILEDISKTSLCENVEHIITVNDTLAIIGLISAELRKRVNIPVICITGTNGKTTVKDILARVLSPRYKVLKSKKSYNNIIGLGLTLFDLEASHDIAVLELGTNRPGEMSILAEIARPNIAIITNIGEGHLEALGNKEGVYAEKMNLCKFLSDEGCAIINRDDKLLANVSFDISPAIKFYGMVSNTDYNISRIINKDGGYDFFVNENSFFVPLKGMHNVYNAAAAISTALYLGVSPEEIQEKLRDVTLSGMRLEHVEYKGISFINDAYNANPDSFECALRVLQNSSTTAKKIVVAGDMLELGQKTEELHRIVGKSIANKEIDCVIGVGDYTKYIVDAAIDAGMEKENALCAVNQEEAARLIQKIADNGTVVLLKGSRGTKMEEVIKCFTISSTV